MMSGMYAAISGLNAHQSMLDVTANNLANVDTVGYKRQSAEFSDELAETIASGGPANGYSAGTNPGSPPSRSRAVAIRPTSPAAPTIRSWSRPDRPASRSAPTET